MNENKNRIRQNDLIDIEKFMMALMVAAIHIVPLAQYNEILYPWLRLAVPFFFLCSSYYFFDKLKYVKDTAVVLKKFVKRNIKLYAFWSLFWFPFILFMNRDVSGIRLIVRLIRGIVFTGTFGGSWYIIAQIEAVLIVYVCRNKNLIKKIMRCIAALCFVLTCLSTNYANLINQKIAAFLQNNSIVPVYLSVIAALPWVALGEFFSDIEIDKVINTWIVVFGGLVGILLLNTEYRMLNTIRSNINDCYFMLILLVPAIFLLGLKTNMHCRYGKTLRKLSTVIFCMHHSLNRAFEFICNRTNYSFCRGVTGGILRYILVLIICYLALKILEFGTGKFKFMKDMI